MSLLCAWLWVSPACARTCDEVKADRDKAKAALDKVQAQQMPEDRIASAGEIVSELQNLLKSQSADQEAVKKRIKQLQDKLPKSDSGIVGGINKFLKGVNEGLGVTGDQAKSLAEKLGEMKEKLDLVQSFYKAGDEAKAQGQIEEFGHFLDGMAKATGITSIPGVKDLAAAYSQGIQGIAKSAGKIEDVVARNEQIYKDAGFTGDMYIHTLTPRQQHQKMIDDLSKRVNDLEHQMSSGDCEQPPKNDPCFDKNTRVARDIAEVDKLIDNSETAFLLKDTDENAHFHFQVATNPNEDPAVRKQAAKSYSDDVARRKALEQEKAQRTGHLLDMASQGWSAADKKIMEDCYPYHSDLMKAARMADQLKKPQATPSPGPSSAAKMAPQAPTPPAAGTTGGSSPSYQQTIVNPYLIQP